MFNHCYPTLKAGDVDERGATVAERTVREYVAARRRELGEPDEVALAPAPSPPGLWTARQVAAHYEVGVSFVYQHADELGAIRLGGGQRPRLRFDPRMVGERWAIVGDALPVTARTRRRTRRNSSGPRASAGRTYELIEYDES